MEKYILDDINECCDDKETLKIGIAIIKEARSRLIFDLDNVKIKSEYDKLGNILTELDEILENYV